MPYVYLLCADQPIGNASNPHGTARHYIGYTENIEQRIRQHRAAKPSTCKNGQPRKRGQAGARLAAAWNAAGIAWRVARTWDGDRDLERWLKRQKRAARFCPYCCGEIQRWQYVGYEIPHPSNIPAPIDLPF